MSQWQHRKGFDILVRAYCQEFFDQDDVELFIKTYRNETSKGSNDETEKNIIVNDISRYKAECSHYGMLPKCKISLKTGFIDAEQLKNMYQEADVFCSPTRGEGFGMTIAQAALSGVPCIVPDLGGHIDYLDKKNNYLIESRYEYLYNMPFGVYSSKEMKYIEPNLSSTIQQLRNAYNDWKKDSLKDRSKSVKIFSRNFLEEFKIYKILKGLLNG